MVTTGSLSFWGTRPRMTNSVRPGPSIRAISGRSPARGDRSGSFPSSVTARDSDRNATTRTQVKNPIHLAMQAFYVHSGKNVFSVSMGALKNSLQAFFDSSRQVVFSREITIGLNAMIDNSGPCLGFPEQEGKPIARSCAEIVGADCYWGNFIGFSFGSGVGGTEVWAPRCGCEDLLGFQFGRREFPGRQVQRLDLGDFLSSGHAKLAEASRCREHPVL